MTDHTEQIIEDSCRLEQAVEQLRGRVPELEVKIGRRREHVDDINGGGE